MSGIIAKRIQEKLISQLKISHLQIINESHMHSVPKNSETHFKLVVVSEDFNGLPIIQCHRKIYTILKDEIKQGIHALSIESKTPKAWEASAKDIEASPNCKGGFGK